MDTLKKSFLSLLFFTLFSVAGFGQSQQEDLVYLKNGGVLRGQIIEQIPQQYLKIEITGGNVLVFSIDEIERIVKEPVRNQERMGKAPLEESNVFFGFMLGISLPQADFNSNAMPLSSTGYCADLINFGYLFSQSFGFSATWYIASNPIDLPGARPWSYRGVLLGPLFSIPLNNRIHWDFWPMLGYNHTEFPNLIVERSQPDNSVSSFSLENEQSRSFAYSLGSSFRFSLSNSIALLLSAEYFASEARLPEHQYQQDINSLNLSLGIAYRVQ